MINLLKGPAITHEKSFLYEPLMLTTVYANIKLIPGEIGDLSKIFELLFWCKISIAFFALLEGKLSVPDFS